MTKEEKVTLREVVMLHAGVGLSTHTDTEHAGREATQTALMRAGSDTADFALVFATAEHGPGYSLLLRTVTETARAAHVVGCSAGGVLTNDGEVERAPGVAVLTVRTDAFSATRFFVPQLRGRGQEVAQEVADRVRPHLQRENLLVIFPDTYNFNFSTVAAGFAQTLPHVPVVGGGASEDGSVGETFQLCGDTVSNNALCGVLLSGNLRHTIGVTHACQPLGPVRTITKAQRNLILELDGKPAFKVFSETVRPPLIEDLRRAAAFVFVGLPVHQEEKQSTPPEYVVRNIVGFDPHQGIVAIGEEVHAGQQMLFTLRDGSGARADLQRTLARQVAAWEGRTPGFGLYFDCIGRGSGLYGLADIDTSYIAQALGNIPLIGFFTGCEIAPIGLQSSLHQYSGVLVLVGEEHLH